jgi:hypothetical protein
MSGIIETLLDEAREKQDLDALVEANQHMLDIIRRMNERIKKMESTAQPVRAVGPMTIIRT